MTAAMAAVAAIAEVVEALRQVETPLRLVTRAVNGLVTATSCPLQLPTARCGPARILRGGRSVSRTKALELSARGATYIRMEQSIGRRWKRIERRGSSFRMGMRAIICGPLVTEVLDAGVGVAAVEEAAEEVAARGRLAAVVMRSGVTRRFGL